MYEKIKKSLRLANFDEQKMVAGFGDVIAYSKIVHFRILAVL